jgi:hypothetical protein
VIDQAPATFTKRYGDRVRAARPCQQGRCARYGPDLATACKDPRLHPADLYPKQEHRWMSTNYIG